MNYIELINLFWQTRRKVRITSVEADLYFFLLQESNNRSWENPLECPNGLICVTIGVTEKTMIEARNRLQQKGLIEFESGKRKSKSPVYTILNCNIYSKNDSIKVSKNRNLKYINKTETIPLCISPKIPGQISVEQFKDTTVNNSLRNEECRRALKCDPGKLSALATEYAADQIAKGNGENYEKEYRVHFINWAKIKLQIEQKNDQNTKRYKQLS